MWDVESSASHSRSSDKISIAFLRNIHAPNGAISSLHVLASQEMGTDRLVPLGHSIIYYPRIGGTSPEDAMVAAGLLRFVKLPVSAFVYLSFHVLSFGLGCAAAQHACCMCLLYNIYTAGETLYDLIILASPSPLTLTLAPLLRCRPYRPSRRHPSTSSPSVTHLPLLLLPVALLLSCRARASWEGEIERAGPVR